MALKEKDKKLALQKKRIKKLKDRVADLVNEDNMDHLAMQQSVTNYSFSDTASVSSQHSQDKTTLTKCVVTMEDMKRREVEVESRHVSS